MDHFLKAFSQPESVNFSFMAMHIISRNTTYCPHNLIGHTLNIFKTTPVLNLVMGFSPSAEIVFFMVLEYKYGRRHLVSTDGVQWLLSWGRQLVEGPSQVHLNIPRSIIPVANGKHHAYPFFVVGNFKALFSLSMLNMKF